jgi:hypothetical protein
MKTTPTTSKVFIAGSRRLSRLNPSVRRRIDNIIEKGLTVIIGDASGVDKAVQTYLSEKHYGSVIVFCMDDACRNNVGNWPVRKIHATESKRRDFAYYSTKDRAMATEADYGFMLWDGHSRGTLTNIVNLVRDGKPVVLCVAPSKSFQTIRDPSQLIQLLGQIDSDASRKVDQELSALKPKPSREPTTGSLLLF